MEATTKCGDCNGTGEYRGLSTIEKCLACGGSGRLAVTTVGEMSTTINFSRADQQASLQRFHEGVAKAREQLSAVGLMTASATLAKAFDELARLPADDIGRAEAINGATAQAMAPVVHPGDPVYQDAHGTWFATTAPGTRIEIPSIKTIDGREWKLNEAEDYVQPLREIDGERAKELLRTILVACQFVSIDDKAMANGAAFPHARVVERYDSRARQTVLVLDDSVSPCLRGESSDVAI